MTVSVRSPSSASLTAGLNPDFCRFFDRLNVVFHSVQRKKPRWHRVIASRASSCWFNASVASFNRNKNHCSLFLPLRVNSSVFILNVALCRWCSRTSRWPEAREPAVRPWILTLDLPRAHRRRRGCARPLERAHWASLCLRWINDLTRARARALAQTPSLS